MDKDDVYILYSVQFCLFCLLLLLLLLWLPVTFYYLLFIVILTFYLLSMMFDTGIPCVHMSTICHVSLSFCLSSKQNVFSSFIIPPSNIVCSSLLCQRHLDFLFFKDTKNAKITIISYSTNFPSFFSLSLSLSLSFVSFEKKKVLTMLSVFSE